MGMDMKIGDIVRYNTLDAHADGIATEKPRLGRLVKREVVTDFNGSRTWWYVVWFSESGTPEDAKAYAGGELVVHISQEAPSGAVN